MHSKPLFSPVVLGVLASSAAAQTATPAPTSPPSAANTGGTPAAPSLVRREKGGELQAVSWKDAIDFVPQKVGAIQEKWGRDAVGVFGGGGLANEKAYLLGKWARVALKTRNIDYNGRFCMASAAAANQKAFGLDRGMPFPMQDIARADAVLLIGSNI